MLPCRPFLRCRDQSTTAASARRPLPSVLDSRANPTLLILLVLDERRVFAGIREPGPGLTHPYYQKTDSSGDLSARKQDGPQSSWNLAHLDEHARGYNGAYA